MDETAYIEFLILANHAESVNGLLYITGGGWTDHHRAVPPGGPPAVSHFGVGISVLIPWNETSRLHRLTVVIEDEDGQAVIAQANAQLKAGRSPLLPEGASQHAVIAIVVDTVFPHPGGYRVVARLNDDAAQARRWPFWVHDMPRQPSAAAPR